MNPLNYDTVGIQAIGILKEIFGVDVDLTLYFSMDALRSFNFDEMEFSVNVEAAASLGSSAEAVVGLSIIGAEGDVQSQASLDLIGLSGLSGQVAGCIPGWSICGGMSVSSEDMSSLNSVGYFVGVGVGFDFSLDIVSGTLVYGNLGEIRSPIIDSIIDFLME